MIDETWIEGLRFDAPAGVKVIGVMGIGSQRVAFRVLQKDGTEAVLKVLRCNLGLHIKELPRFLTAKPEYDVNRLNLKLLRLVGNPLLDSMTRPYDDLYTVLLHILHESGVEGLRWSIMTPESIENIPFILQTPGMKRRLQELASLEEVSDPSEMRVSVGNPERYGFQENRTSLAERAKENLQHIERVSQVNPDMQPERLAENPLFVWSAAVMDGFFTDEELPQAVAFLKKHYGPFPEHPQVATFLEQVYAIAHLLAQFSLERNLSRFVKLCALAGLVFQVVDRDGNEVADGVKLLRVRLS